MQFITSSLLSLLSVLLVSLVVEAQPLEKRLPNGPAGSRLVQFNPSTCQTSKTVPMFVNSAWSSDSSSPSSASHAFIVQHGLGRDVNVAWSDLYPVVGDSRVLVAPGFNLESDSSNVSTYRTTFTFVDSEKLTRELPFFFFPSPAWKVPMVHSEQELGLVSIK